MLGQPEVPGYLRLSWLKEKFNVSLLNTEIIKRGRFNLFNTKNFWTLNWYHTIAHWVCKSWNFSTRKQSPVSSCNIRHQCFALALCSAANLTLPRNKAVVGQMLETQAWIHSFIKDKEWKREQLCPSDADYWTTTGVSLLLTGPQKQFPKSACLVQPGVLENQDLFLLYQPQINAGPVLQYGSYLAIHTNITTTHKSLQQKERLTHLPEEVWMFQARKGYCNEREIPGLLFSPPWKVPR